MGDSLRSEFRFAAKFPAAPPGSLQDFTPLDFVHDQLAHGPAFRVLTVIDNWSRKSMQLEAGFRLTGQGVADALRRAGFERPLPRAITVDHGTEFTSRARSVGLGERRGARLHTPGQAHG
jgi:putative transposase